MIGGRAEFSCEDGLAGKVTYRHLHKESGTASGRGRTSDGHVVQVWSGHRLLQFCKQLRSLWNQRWKLPNNWSILWLLKTSLTVSQPDQ